MDATTQEQNGRAVPRPWCVPPAIRRDPGDGLEGDHVLAESPGDFGLLLWRTVRDVTLWADTPLERRGELFREGSRLALLAATEIPPEVSAAVDTLHGMLTLGSRADTELVSQCCLQVAAWARRSGLARTAVVFAQAGALVSPWYAEAAVHVGAYARAAGGQEARAGTWLRRALGLPDGSHSLAPFSYSQRTACAVNGNLLAPPGAVAFVHTHPFVSGER
jgi:hypothetical protein